MNDSTLPNTSRRSRPSSLRPGFALHDWLTLLRHAKDLSGRRGAPLRHDITLSEVSRHKFPHDGWIVLHRKVYNIGPYLMYHPGGSEILEKCLGKDATALFEKYHAWVNIEGLIGPLLVGFLSKGERRKNESDDGEQVGGKYLSGTGRVDDGDEKIVVPPGSSTTSQIEFAMPKPRPKKGESIPSLLGNANSDDEEISEELL